MDMESIAVLCFPPCIMKPVACWYEQADSHVQFVYPSVKSFQVFWDWSYYMNKTEKTVLCIAFPPFQ